jgi:hypothetical protein
MKLTALKSFTYAGKRISPGQEFDASAQHVKLFVALRRAKMETASVPDPVPMPVQEMHRPRGRLRKNTDAIEAKPVAAENTDVSAISMHYQTRRLTATEE